MTIRVGVIGAAGRMGQTVCAAISADQNLELVAAVDSAASGSTVEGLTIAKDLRALADAKVDVAVDFTVAAASRINLPWLAMHNVHAVVGTTGFTDADIAEFKKMFTSSNCIVAPNFAIGAVLMMRFAEIAAASIDLPRRIGDPLPWSAETQRFRRAADTGPLIDEVRDGLGLCHGACAILNPKNRAPIRQEALLIRLRNRPARWPDKRQLVVRIHRRSNGQILDRYLRPGLIRVNQEAIVLAACDA
jgi:hypothetical protein